MATLLNKEATVRTASVEVKALTIDSKQVTLSVFRQVPEKDLIDYETGTLLGTPWGRINYYWADLPRKHTHILWQQGDELYRFLANPDPALAVQEFLDTAIDYMHLAITLYAESFIIAGRDLPDGITLKRDGLLIVTKAPGIVWSGEGEEINSAIRNTWMPGECRYTVIRDHTNARDPAEAERDCLAVVKEYFAAKEACQEILKRCIALTESLQELPQLYIAV